MHQPSSPWPHFAIFLWSLLTFWFYLQVSQLTAEGEKQPALRCSHIFLLRKFIAMQSHIQPGLHLYKAAAMPENVVNWNISRGLGFLCDKQILRKTQSLKAREFQLLSWGVLPQSVFLLVFHLLWLYGQFYLFISTAFSDFYFIFHEQFISCLLEL